MQVLPPHPPYLRSALLAEHRGVKHGFFGAQGGTSSGLYTSLNCGPMSQDALACVSENRARVAAVFAIKAEKLISCKQIHSSKVLVIDSAELPQNPVAADGLVTNRPDIGLSVLGADCAPILFSDPVNKIIGAAHAGWKGALDGIIEAVIDAMCHLGASRELIQAAIGPAMQLAHFEVQCDFMPQFLISNTVEAAPCFVRRAGKVYFDLPHYIVLRLNAAGVGSHDKIIQDTYTQPGKYFSYRRSRRDGEADYGRQISVISLSKR